MRKFLNTFPLHTFLFTFFVCAFLLTHNQGQVELFMVKRTLIAGNTLSLIFICIFYLFTRNIIKSGISSTLILLVLFNYGVLYDLIEVLYYANLWPFNNIHRYLSGFIIATCFLIIWLVQKKIKTGIRMNYFLNILLILLIVFNVSKLTYLNINTGISHNIENPKIKNGQAKINPPNLYYIMLDGYANQRVLKKYYGFDNSDFTSFLNSNGFYIADSSFSNYYSTQSSLAATLNMDYLTTTSTELRRSQLLNNKFFKILKTNGYKLYQLQSGFSVTNGFSEIDSNIVISGPNEFERSILKFTIFRLDDLFGMIHHMRLKSQFKKLNEIAQIKNNQKFTFIHIVAPHPPFVFNSNGEQMYNDKHHYNSWEPKENYIEQLIYLNKVIKSFISKIVANDKSGVIILQSDHGPWIQSPDENVVFEARSLILNAVRYPGLENSIFTNSVSSVNTFRIFTKQYIDSTYQLLKDSTAGKEEIMTSILFKERKKH